jgi:hypothetical protein
MTRTGILGDPSRRKQSTLSEVELTECVSMTNSSIRRADGTQRKATRVSARGIGNMVGDVVE